MPQARLSGLKAPIAGVGFSEAGIDFDSPDGDPAKMIILLLTPEGEHRNQLEVLADIARTFRPGEMLHRAMSAANHLEFLALMKSEIPAGATRERKEG